MKKVLVLFVLAFVLSVSRLQPVLGLDSTDSANTNRNSEIQKRIEETKEIREQRQEEFQLRLQEIKDTRKQKIVANLGLSYVNINNRWTTHFINVLERLTKILDKVGIKAEEQQNSEALNSINNIYSQIDEVKTAVKEQALKTYTIEITGEDKLGEAAKAVHSQLRNDLQVLREQIKEIRESIRAVIQTL